jgi:hypothetical protein
MSVDRSVMTKAAQTVIARQDDGDVNGILELFAEDCTFMMPVAACRSSSSTRTG